MGRSRVSSVVPRSVPVLVVCSALFWQGAPATLRAEAPPRYDARSDRLAGFTSGDLAVLAAQLERGPVALVEFADTKGDELPGVHLATLVRAPASALAGLVADPTRYPRFVRTLDEVERVHQRGAAQVYDWAWKIGLFRLSGRNAMTAFPPPANRPDAGWRYQIDSQGGDFGAGRIVIRVLPRGADASLLLVSLRLDLRESNYIARQLARAARSINRSANMSLAYAMALSFRREAERRAGHAPVSRPPSALRRPDLDPRKLARLLSRGDLVTMNLAGDTLEQIAVFGLIHRDRATVREVMLDANAFGSALVPGSAAQVIARAGPITTFDWQIDLPLVGASGRMRMRDADPVVTIEAIEGALNGGEWRFEAHALSKHATMVSGWASFDLTRSTWLLEALANADPYLGHGMSAASEVMLVRALRSRSDKHRVPR